MITLSMPSTHYMVFTPNLSVSRFFFTDQCKWPLSTHSCVRFLYFPDRLLVTVSFFLSQTGIISILFPFFLLMELSFSARVDLDRITSHVTFLLLTLILFLSLTSAGFRFIAKPVEI